MTNIAKSYAHTELAKISSLREIADFLSPSGGLAEMMPYLIELAARLSGFERAAMVLRDDRIGHFAANCSEKLSGGFKFGYTALTHDLLFERRFLQTEPVLIEAVDTIEEPDAGFLKNHGISHRIILPLIVEDRAIGLLEFYPPSAKDITEQSLALARAIADHASVAIDNVILYSNAERLAVADGLTGLNSFQHFHRQLTLDMKRSRRYDEELCMIFVDIDGFQNFNKTHGRLICNILLADFARMISSCLREVDFVARIEDDTFSIILPETALEGATIVAERLLISVESFQFKAGNRSIVNLTACIGVIEFDHDMITADNYIEAASETLQLAKQKGPNSLQVRDARPKEKKS